MKGKIVKMEERKKGRGRKKRKQGKMERRNNKRKNGRKRKYGGKEERKNGKKKKRKEERNKGRMGKHRICFHFIFKKHCIFFNKLSSFTILF